MPRINEGKDVIIFAHSSGGTFTGGAKTSLAKSARKARGQKGGVLGLVYISFALTPEGQTQLEYMGGQWPAFIKLDNVSVDIVYNQLLVLKLTYCSLAKDSSLSTQSSRRSTMTQTHPSTRSWSRPT